MAEQLLNSGPTVGAREIAGQAGQATLLDAALQRPATVSIWFLELPGQPAPWFHHYVSVVDFRKVEGRAPMRQYPEATHELLIGALDPLWVPRVGAPKTWKPILPPQLNHQFHGLPDSGGYRLAEFAARQIVDGHLAVNPDRRAGAHDVWRTALFREGERLCSLVLN